MAQPNGTTMYTGVLHTRESRPKNSIEAKIDNAQKDIVQREAREKCLLTLRSSLPTHLSGAPGDPSYLRGESKDSRAHLMMT